MKRSEKSRVWTDEESERVLEALASLPLKLLASSVNGIYRLNRAQEFSKNPAAGLGNSIVLYDAAFDDKGNLARILAHEYAHKIFRQLSDADDSSYSIAAQWKSTTTSSGTRVSIPMRERFVEEDGKENPDEDFSNNIEYFLFDSGKLKSLNPTIHEWIRERYGNGFKINRGAKQ